MLSHERRRGRPTFRLASQHLRLLLCRPHPGSVFLQPDLDSCFLPVSTSPQRMCPPFPPPPSPAQVTSHQNGRRRPPPRLPAMTASAVVESHVRIHLRCPRCLKTTPIGSAPSHLRNTLRHVVETCLCIKEMGPQGFSVSAIDPVLVFNGHDGILKRGIISAALKWCRRRCCISP